MRPALPLLTAGVLALAVLGLPAAAATFTVVVGSASDNAVGGCTGGGQSSGSSAVSIGGVCGDTVGVIGANASSSFGHLGARATAVTFGGSSLPGVIGGLAIFSDTLTFTSSDPLATFADVSLNVALDGVLNAAANAALGGSAGARLDGHVAFGGGFFQFIFANNTNFGNPIFFTLNTLGVTQGVIAPLTNAQLVTPTVRVSLNAPVFFEMALGAGAFAVGSGASATSDFSGSFKLPTGSNVFNLPAGVTVNAGNYLVNNRFFDPLDTPANAPEPASWALMLAGFGMAGAALRRRRALAA